jgi:virulence factor Mce-like protein
MSSLGDPTGTPRGRRSVVADVLGNHVLIGTITILVVIVAVYLSYIAENGLPFVPTYNIKADVSNADEIGKNADVRIGGARVGQVLSIVPEPASATWPHPFARLGLALDRNLDPLPPDTRYRIRLASVLGGKYLEIIPGHHKTGGLPDGGTFTLNSNPRLNHELPFVDLDTAFATFGPRTQSAIRSSTEGLAYAVAGRGSQINDTIHSVRQLIGPLQSLLHLLAAPGTRLSAFVTGAAGTTAALAPVAGTLNSLLSDSATTFDALQRSELGQTLDQLPPTETVGTNVLTAARPVLSDAAAITQALKPAAPLLGPAANSFDAVIVAFTPVWRAVPAVADDLRTAAVAVDALARDPASTQTFKVLGSSDLATFGASAFQGLGAILQAVAPAQFACNVAGLWTRNFVSSLSEGNSIGPWLRVTPVFDTPPNQSFQASTPSADLHLNYYPIQDATQCQAGNERYTGTQLIGNPPRTSSVVDNTTPPPGVLERGRKAGLVP